MDSAALRAAQQPLKDSYRADPDNDDHQARAGLVIGYGRPPEHAYTTALARLCAILPDFL